MECRLAIIQKGKRERGPYVPRTRGSNERDLLAGLELTGEVDGERYVLLSSSDLLLENMKRCL